MGRRPCCEKEEVNSGAWTTEEDRILIDYVKAHGEGRWGRLPKNAGLNRCGKSCRFRWLNYLRPGIKRGNISPDEEELILRLHKLLGNRWSLIAGRLPGRTDNEIKNYWNTNLCKRARVGGNPKLKAPRKLRCYPDKSEGKSNLKLEENDNALGNPCYPVQPLLLETEQPVSSAAFWAATLKLSEVDIDRQLSLQRGEENDRCFGVNTGGPRPWPPSNGDVSVKSDIAEVEKDGATTGSTGGVEAGEILAEDPLMDFDIGDICLSDLLNSELLMASNSSSTSTLSDPRLAFSYEEPKVQEWNQQLCL